MFYTTRKDSSVVLTVANIQMNYCGDGDQSNELLCGKLANELRLY